ncbi:MAG: TIGR03118 family protein [Steroidobacteraceae bacterium]
MRRKSMAMAAACALVLAACGGGGYGGGGSMSPPPPTLTISVAPGSIVLGQSATVTWSSSSGSSCTASDAWSGTVAASGSSVVTPTALGTATYTLTCAGGGAYGGNVAKSTALTVTAPSAFSATKLVADTAGVGAVTTDANLVNAWGIAFGPTSPSWVANNHSETSTLYDGNGAAKTLVVSFPSSPGTSFDPTGIVFNGSSDFVISSGASSGAARFIFVGEGGMLAGWSSSADPSNAITVYTAADGAVYKGLAIASNGGGNFLYATDFHNGKVDVFDASFARQTPSGTSFTFSDPNLPAGYAPFGIQALKTGAAGATQIYVSYAKQDTPPSNDNVNGAGLGLVDIYDTNGQFIRQLVPTGGRLNAPWGIALAPANFGTLSNALLVGNFGDGKINGFDVASGAYLGTVADSTGAAFAVPGLWAIVFGNDAVNQPRDTLFYAAGTNNEVNGEYGRIDLGASPPVLGAAPVLAVTAPAAGSVSGTVTVTATATDAIAIARVELFANGASLTVCTASPCSVSWDTTTVANGSFSLTAVASDANRNVATSAAVAVTVANVAPAAATLSQLQTSIFTPICSGCHTGIASATANGLPGNMNLTAGNAFAALVDVSSIEKPTLKRVNPGDAANSYIIHKLEGAAGIVGVRMPANGPPYLDQATIDQVKSLINAGALNN